MPIHSADYYYQHEVTMPNIFKIIMVDCLPSHAQMTAASLRRYAIQSSVRACQFTGILCCSRWWHPHWYAVTDRYAVTYRYVVTHRFAVTHWHAVNHWYAVTHRCAVTHWYVVSHRYAVTHRYVVIHQYVLTQRHAVAYRHAGAHVLPVLPLSFIESLCFAGHVTRL